SLRRRVRGNVGHRLERGSGGQYQNIAAPSRGHLTQIEMGEMNHCSAIYLNHLEEALLINEWEFAEFAEAGIVDTQVDFNSFFSRESIDPLPSRRIGQIGGKTLWSELGGPGQPFGQSL